MAATFAAIALVLLVLPDPPREALAQAARLTVLRPVLALQRGAADQDGRWVDVGALRAERDSLAAFLVGQAHLSAENQRLRSLLGLRERLSYSFVPAEVIRVQGPAYVGSFLLTAGQRDGVRPSSPIVTGDGLAGMVLSTDAGSGIGIDWTHPDFRASAMTTDGEVFGIVEPRGSGEGEELLVLTGTAFHTQLKPGTMIVTSGRGGVYPRGIPIGTVAGAEDEQGGWRRSYLIRPLVTPTEMIHVLVLGQPTPGETTPDLAAAWGIQTTAPADTVPATPQLPGGAVLAPVASPSPTPAPQPRTAPVRREPEGPRLLGRPVERPTPRDSGEGRR